IWQPLRAGAASAIMANAFDGGNRTKAVRGAPPARPSTRTPEPSMSQAETVGSARSILRGELQNVGLPTLLTIVDMERRSGLLLVQRERARGGLFVRGGRVVRARIEGTRRGEGPTTGAEAVYQLLTWPDGQFELWQAEV